MSFIGLDIGTAGCKAILLGENGLILAEAAGQYDLITPHPGWAELDPNQVFSSVKDVIGKVAGFAKSDQVKAMSVSSMGDTIVPCDSESRPIGNSILAFDTRNVNETIQLKKSLDPAWVFQVTGQPIHPSYSIVKILWIRQQCPELFKAAQKYLCYEDFITAQLCGEPVISHSSAGRTMAFDIRNKIWNDDLLEIAGINESNLAKPAPSGQAITKIKPKLAAELGLSTNVVIVSGGHDQPCGALGSGYFSNDSAIDSTGSVEVLLITCPDPLLSDQMLNANICFWPHAVKDKYCTCGQILTAGAALRWFRDVLGAGEDYDTITSRFSNAPTELLFIPHLAGSGTPEFSPTARGAFFGATLQTNKYEIAKSIIEGVCFELKLNINLLENSGIRINKLRAIGGATRSQQWMQLKADIIGMSLEACSLVNQCPLGAALLAACGIGFFHDPAETTEFITHKTKQYVPDEKSSSMYDQKFQKYLGFRKKISDLCG